MVSGQRSAVSGQWSARQWSVGSGGWSHLTVRHYSREKASWVNQIGGEAGESLGAGDTRSRLGSRDLPELNCRAQFGHCLGRV